MLWIRSYDLGSTHFWVNQRTISDSPDGDLTTRDPHKRTFPLTRVYEDLGVVLDVVHSRPCRLHRTARARQVEGSSTSSRQTLDLFPRSTRLNCIESIEKGIPYERYNEFIGTMSALHSCSTPLNLLLSHSHMP